MGRCVDPGVHLYTKCVFGAAKQRVTKLALVSRVQ